ncbi:MAG: hypothetical protein E7070_02400 [Bacteroidales bacterium]|nr:hypothetical protein [Bacteroidales bacterium]
MNTHLFFKGLAIFLGYVLIIAGFFVFGSSLAADVKTLDIVASCLIFSQFVLLFVFPMVDFTKKEHKEIGMMGIYYVVLNVCCLGSLGFMAAGIVFGIAFKYQLMVQLFFLFVMLVGIAASLHAGKKVESVYAQEQSALRGRDSMKVVMSDFMDELALRQGEPLDAQLLQRLQSVLENVRYIAPSRDERASAKEEQFRQTLSSLRNLLKDVSFNSSRIDAEVTRLEQIVRQRKNVHSI